MQRLLLTPWRRLLSHGSRQAGKVVAVEEFASVLPASLPDSGKGGGMRHRRQAPAMETGRERRQQHQHKRMPYFDGLFSSLNTSSHQNEEPRSEALGILRKGSKDVPSGQRVPKINLLDNQYIPSRRSEGPVRGTRKTARGIVATSLPLGVASKERLAHVPTASAIKTFAEMRLPGWLLEALAIRNIHQPTPTQQRLIGTMLEHDMRRRFIYVRAQTGTGKSLGYVIALLAGLHREHLPARIQSPSGGERCGCLHLILVPNAILGLQLLRWIKSLVADNAHWSENLARIVKALLPTEVLDDEYPAEVTEPRGFSHILITTPGQAQAMLAQGTLSLEGMRDIIIDEVDAQLRPLPEHAPRRRLVNRARHPNPTLTLLGQLYRVCSESGLTPPRPILASATLNGGCRLDLLRATGIKGAKYVTIDQARADTADNGGDGTARTSRVLLSCPPSIKHYYRMLKDAESVEELLGLIRRVVSGHEGQTGALFVPAAKSKVAISEMLRRLGIACELLANMTVQGSGSPAANRLLIGSDVDARGWDMPSLAYVIIVDMPQSATHYLHMAGRVGRMGSPGTVYTVVAGQKDLERLAGIYSMLRLAATPVPQEVGSGVI